MKESDRRRFPRVPLKMNVLYEDEGSVFRAQTINISVGGLCLHTLPHYPSREIICILFALPELCLMEQIPNSKLFSIVENGLPRHVCRVKMQTVLKTSQTTTVEQVFRENIGGEFYLLSSDVKDKIAHFVNLFSLNLQYLSKLPKEKQERTQLIANILGYDDQVAQNYKNSFDNWANLSSKF